MGGSSVGIKSKLSNQVIWINTGCYLGEAQWSLYLGMRVCSLGCENTLGIQNMPCWASWLAQCPRRRMSVALTRMRGFAMNFWQIASEKTCIYEFLRAHSLLWHEIFFCLMQLLYLVGMLPALSCCWSGICVDIWGLKFGGLSYMMFHLWPI